MAKVFSYCRFSDKKQATGTSIERQIERQKVWLDRHPEHVLDTTISPRDLGKSGFHGYNLKDGGALAGFIALVKQPHSPIPKGSILLIESLDRFSRLPPTEVAPIFYELVHSGINVQTLQPEQTITHENIDEPNTLLPINLYMSIAHEQSKQKSYWATKAHKSARDKARQGIPMSGQCPSWLEYNENLRKHNIKAGAKKTILFIFNSVADGLGQKQVTYQLNRSKHKPFGRAKLWHPSFIGWIIPNRQVLGEFQPHTQGKNGERVPDGLPIANYFPKIVDDELFHRANGVRVGRHKQRGPNTLFVNLFVGLVWGVDGYPYWVKGAKAERKTKAVYVQRRLTSKGRILGLLDACPIGVDYWIIETMILSAINEIKQEDIEPSRPDDGELMKKLAAREGIEKRTAELQTALSDLSPKAKPIPQVVAAIGELEDKKELLDRTIEKLQQEQAATDNKPFQQTQSVLGLIASKPSKEQHALRMKLRGLLATLIERITIEPYKIGNACGASLDIEMKTGELRLLVKTSGDWIPAKIAAKVWNGKAKGVKVIEIVKSAEDLEDYASHSAVMIGQGARKFHWH